MNSLTQTLQVLVVGSREVGKTKLLDRLMQKPFTEIYNPSQNPSSLNYTLELEGKSFDLHITEMNKIPFKLFQSSAIPQFQYIIFVYDLSRVSTWHDLKKYKEHIEKYLDQNSQVRCFIIGNKADKANLVDVAKFNFFATHIQISAAQEAPDQKEACMKIWNSASFLKHQVIHPPLEPPENWVEKSFNASIPTAITRIQGNCKIDAQIKAIIIGAENVGKTQMSQSLNDEPFSEVYMPTIGVDFRMMRIGFQGKKYRVQVWDTAGQERFRTITNSYYRAVNICFLVYDITNPESFDQIQGFHKNLTQVQISPAESFLSVLIGNKSDLQGKRKVSFEEGQGLAENLNMKFYEVSVKERHGVMEAILTALEEFLISKKLQ